MAAAIPIIGSMIVSMVVSKAVQALGPKLGLSEDMSSLLGTVAGAYAGGVTYNSATGATGMSGAGAGTTAPSVSNVPGTPIAPSAQAISNIPGTPIAPTTSPYSASSPEPLPSRGGMMTEPGTITPPAGADTADSLIKSETVPGSLADNTQQSWMERLFSSEKTMDLVMAGMQGYGQAGIAKEQMEYPEKVATKNAALWADAYPGLLSLSGPKTPSQGGG